MSGWKLFIRMQPGRFVSLWFLFLGALMLVPFVLGVAFGEVQLQLSLNTLGILLPGIGSLFMGVSRIRNPEQEEWPEEYGLWTYAAVLFLVGGTVWLLYLELF